MVLDFAQLRRFNSAGLRSGRRLARHATTLPCIAPLLAGRFAFNTCPFSHLKTANLHLGVVANFGVPF